MNKTSIRSALAAAALLAASFLPAAAQDVLSREETLKIAVMATLQGPAATDLPLTVDTDLKRGLAGHDGEYGLLILPETKLTADVIGAAGKQPIPVAHLWLRKLTPIVNGDPVETDKLRMVSVAHDGESFRAPLCVLGVRKGAGDGLELVLFGKSKEPLLAVPLSKTSRQQALPIEISAERESDSGKVRFFLGGKYEATISVTELAE